MTSKLKRHFKQFATGVLVAAMGASVYVVAAVSFPDFTTGSIISASEMNAKLNALKDAVNAAPVAGPPGPAGPIGPAGATGPAGPAGPSATAQNRVENNTSMSLTCGTPTTITTLTITGPAVYLITASGFVFSSGAVPSQVLLAVDLYRDATQLAHGEVGANVVAIGHLPGSYAYSRLINVAGASSTIQVRGCRQSGDGTPIVFSNSLTATLVGSGTGAQLALLPVEGGLPAAEGTR